MISGRRGAAGAGGILLTGFSGAGAGFRAVFFAAGLETGFACLPEAPVFFDAAGAGRGAVFFTADTELAAGRLTGAFVFVFSEALAAGLTAGGFEAGFFAAMVFFETGAAGIVTFFPGTAVFCAPVFFFIPLSP